MRACCFALALGLSTAGCSLLDGFGPGPGPGNVTPGSPSAWERALFMAANRARSDPATLRGAQSTVFPAVAPLVLIHELELSARFHATTLATGKAPLMHESPCTL